MRPTPYEFFTRIRLRNSLEYLCYSFRFAYDFSLLFPSILLGHYFLQDLF